MYKIGLYNKKVDDCSLLSNCNIVFNNFEDVKNHARGNDVIVIISAFSLYGIDTKEFLDFIEENNIGIEIISSNSYENTNKLFIDMSLAIMEFISNNKENINKIYEV